MIKLENLKSVAHSDELNIVQIKEDLNKKQIFTLNINVDILYIDNPHLFDTEG